jgi:hypothetical protein
MTQLRALGILGLAAALVIGVGASAASAMKVGGSAGKAASSADSSCADYAYGSLTNSCSSTKSFIVPLPVETEGSKALSFRGKGATSSNNVGCKGTAMSDTGLAYWATPTVYLSQFGSMQDVSLGDLYVGAEAPVYMLCSIDNGGKLFTVEWEQ